MNDDQLFALLDRLEGLPRLTVRDRRFIFDPTLDALIVWTRVGKGDRWSFSPSSGVVPMARAGDAVYWFGRDVVRWAERARRMDFAAHARAMGARVL